VLSKNERLGGEERKKDQGPCKKKGIEAPPGDAKHAQETRKNRRKMENEKS